MNIAAVVILYYPDKKIVSRILSYANFVNRVYVIDNSEDNKQHIDFLSSLSQLSQITYIQDGENKGIAMRLNQAVNLALRDNCDWLLTMDQDSYFPDDTVPIYFGCIDNYTDIKRTAMFGVQFIKNPSGLKDCIAKEVTHLITSGSVLNLNLFKEIGDFDEALFIDKVDHEYCLRASLLNYKIVQFDSIFLNHNLGTISFGRSLKNFRLTPRVLHSPIRMYYILRNYFYLHSKYKGLFTESFLEMKRELANRIKNNFLYGNDKVQLLKFLLKGYNDFKKGNMGKIKS